MRISFIIPAYNEEAYLANSIKAILKEIEREKISAEVIVVNNASTDRTVEVAKRFPGAKVIDEPKKGLVQARQAGYRHATGELIANIDADTRIPEGWLKKVLYEFERKTDLVCLSGPYSFYDLSKFANRFLITPFYAAAQFLHFFTHSIVQGGNFVVRKKALDAIDGYNPSLTFFCEDADIGCRMKRIGTVKFLPSLVSPSSGRRIKKEGFLKTGIIYALNYFWMVIFGKPLHYTWTDVREKSTTSEIFLKPAAGSLPNL